MESVNLDILTRFTPVQVGDIVRIEFSETRYEVVERQPHYRFIVRDLRTGEILPCMPRENLRKLTTINYSTIA